MSKKYKDVFITTTDTVMGIGIPIYDDPKKIFELKKRPINKNLIITIGSFEQAKKFKDWNITTEKLAKKVWPGNTTLVLSPSLALRIPDNNQLRELLIKKGPCYLTSANISGQKEATSIKEAKKIFPEVSQFYDFGPMSGKASTIIDVSTGKVLR